MHKGILKKKKKWKFKLIGKIKKKNAKTFHQKKTVTTPEIIEKAAHAQ